MRRVAALLLVALVASPAQAQSYANGGLQFTCTTADQAISPLPTISASTPVVVQIQYPGGTDAGVANTGYVLIGWHGEDATAASTETLQPGQGDQFKVTKAPHCAVPSGQSSVVIKVIF